MDKQHFRRGAGVVYSLALLYSGSVLADLPLTVEDLLTAKGRYRLDANLVFANSSRRQTGLLFQTIQTGTGQFIRIPVGAGDERRNTDTFLATLGFRYGVTLDSELYTRISALDRVTRTRQSEGPASASDSWVNDWLLGINHRFSPDNDTPALLGFLEATLAENTRQDATELVYGKTWHAGFTTYRTIDPLVLSFTAGYRHALERPVEGADISPGSLFYLNPSVGFAVNHEISLLGGLHLHWQGRDTVDGRKRGIDRTWTRVELGMAWATSRRMTLRINLRADVSGDEGAETGVTLLYKFGGLPEREHEHGESGDSRAPEEVSGGGWPPATGQGASNEAFQQCHSVA